MPCADFDEKPWGYIVGDTSSVPREYQICTNGTLSGKLEYLRVSSIEELLGPEAMVAWDRDCSDIALTCVSIYHNRGMTSFANCHDDTDAWYLYNDIHCSATKQFAVARYVVDEQRWQRSAADLYGGLGSAAAGRLPHDGDL